MYRPSRSRPSLPRASGKISRTTYRPDPRVLRGLRQVALAGLALVLVWPAARGSSEWFGWLPMWLVGMPWLAWWALLRFPMPRRQPRRVQARRRGRAAPRAPRAA